MFFCSKEINEYYDRFPSNQRTVYMRFLLTRKTHGISFVRRRIINFSKVRFPEIYTATLRASRN